MLLEGDPVDSLDVYVDRGGLAALARLDEEGHSAVVDELVASGLRGRGGAGFPTGVKWRSILDGGDEAGQRFVVANGAEGEPGTFKDRALLRHNPYLLIEGVLVAARTVGAPRVFVALKESFTTEAVAVQTAASAFASAGLAEGVQIELVLGPDEYLFGEEKALLEVIEGEDPLPRLVPPYLYGLFTTSPQVGWSAGRSIGGGANAGSNPTLVNNVETLSTVPLVVGRGAAWYRSHGTAESPGTIICTVSGDTVAHGVGEYEMGTPLRTVLADLGGGMPPGRSVRYVLSGVSNAVLRAGDLDTPLTYEAMVDVGGGLGTGGFIVLDDRTDPRELARAVSQFLYVESCGQCPACKLGTGRITELLDESTALTPNAVSELTARLTTVTDSSRCFLPAQEQRLIASLVPDIRAGHRGEHRGIEITKIVDLVGDRFELDERQRRKQPDWTYRP